MNGFSGLSYAQIENIADGLKTDAGSMQDILNKVKEQLTKVGGEETWSGTAANAVFEEFNTLMGKFPSFVEAVTSCSTHLNKVVSTYKSVDAQVTSVAE